MSCLDLSDSSATVWNFSTLKRSKWQNALPKTPSSAGWEAAKKAITASHGWVVLNRCIERDNTWWYITGASNPWPNLRMYLTEDFSGRTFFVTFDLGPRRPLLVSGAIVRMDRVAVWQVLYRTPGKAARHHCIKELPWEIKVPCGLRCLSRAPLGSLSRGGLYVLSMAAVYCPIRQFFVSCF